MGDLVSMTVFGCGDIKRESYSVWDKGKNEVFLFLGAKREEKRRRKRMGNIEKPGAGWSQDSEQLQGGGRAKEFHKDAYCLIWGSGSYNVNLSPLSSPPIYREVY